MFKDFLRFSLSPHSSGAPQAPEMNVMELHANLWMA